MTDSAATAEAAGQAETAEPGEPMGWFHTSVGGRLLVSALLVLLSVCIVGWNLPGQSEVRSDIRAKIRPVVYTLGIDQGWGVFAPNPSKTSVIVEAEVAFSDGTTERFEFPDGDPFIGAYREFRWRKLERRFRTDSSWTSLRSPTAEWIARQFVSSERAVTSVTLVRYLARTPRAGSDDERVYERDDFYTKTFNPPLGGEALGTG